MESDAVVTSLAKFCRGLQFEVLPPEVVTKAKQLVLDHLGGVLACSVLPLNESTCDYVRMMNAGGNCTVVGRNLRTNMEYAVLANTTFAQGFEIDDYLDDHGPVGHVSALTVPVALALAQTRPVSGKRMIQALVAGNEVMAGVARGIQPTSQFTRGFHAQSSCGPFATAAVAGVLLEQDVSTLANAFSIAASHAGGILEYTNAGGSIKRLHTGIAAVGGLRSALLAARGWTGPLTAMEGKRGFCQAFAPEYDIEAITHRLGSKYSILRTTLKPYACNGSVIPAIDALRAVLAERSITPGDVEEIQVHHSSLQQKSCGNIGPEPKDIVAAQFSVHFSLGMTLVKGENDFYTYLNVDLKDPEILAVARKVRTTEDSRSEEEVAHSRFLAGVTVLTKDGQKLNKYCYAKGSPENPMTQQEVEAKFRGLASAVLKPKEVEALLKQCEHLELVDDVSTIASSLAKS